MHSLHNLLLANTIENDHKRPPSLGFFHRALLNQEPFSFAHRGLCSTKERLRWLIAIFAQPTSVFDCSLNEFHHFLFAQDLSLQKFLWNGLEQTNADACAVCVPHLLKHFIFYFAHNLSHAVYEKNKGTHNYTGCFANNEIQKQQRQRKTTTT